MNPDQFLRRAGYGYVVDRRNGQNSYSRRLGAGLYPRFHVYYEEDNDTVIFNVHLDQKRATSIGAARKHHGEYDGSIVEAEVARLKQLIVSLVRRDENN